MPAAQAHLRLQMVRLCSSSFSEKIKESAPSFPGKQASVTKTNLTIAIDYFAGPRTGKNWLKTAQSGANDRAT